MGALIGLVIGGFMAVAILSAVIERVAFEEREPTKRAELTVGLAFVLASLLAGFGFADGGPFVWTAGVAYLPGAIAVFVWYRKRYSAVWVVDDDELVAD